MNENNQSAIPAASINLASLQGVKSGDTITLLEALDILWKRRYLLLLFLIIGASIGIFLGNWIRPQYSSDALLKLDTKGSKAGKAMGEMGALLEVGSPADAEIPVIKSRSVLDFVVDAEGLCFNATPIGFMDRIRHREGRMDLTSLEFPADKAKGWTATVTDANSYDLYDPTGQKILSGVVGTESKAIFDGDTVSILVNKIKAQKGQRFALSTTTPLKAVRNLAKSLNISEQGKQTGVIGITYSHRYPDRAKSILNTVARIYQQQNIEMHNEEAKKTLDFLQTQLPLVKAKLDSAEKSLTDYQNHVGSVDVSGETHALLQKEQELNAQILSLEQKHQETARLFKEEHPAVQTILKQQRKLRKELSKLKTQASKMPLTQQEVFALKEQTVVNNALYTSMLSNIQQLQIVHAGEVGSVRVVDFAVEDSEQTKPRKMNILICSVAASLMLGILLVFLLRMMKSGVRNALEIERETGVSVYAKIPETKYRALHSKKKRRKNPPLVCAVPDDSASEALRSLFTGLKFSITTKNPVLMVAGLTAGAGKSFISRNIAALNAIQGKKTLLIDADMRRGVVYSKHRNGLAEILMGKCSTENCVSESETKNLYVIKAGNAVFTPTDLLQNDSFGKLIEWARTQFDAIIIDTPPISLVTDAELLIPYVNFILFVLHYGRHSMDQIKENVIKVERLTDCPKAFVMNHCEHDLSYGYYGGYGYYGKYKK